MSSQVSSLIRKGLPMVTRAAENQYAPVGKWIFGTAGLVVGMIHVGGITRLTQSGLSMTNWSPLGGLPPITADEWEAEFTRYQNFPEYEQRKGMTLSEFQFIYAWEYGHRMLGRVVGVCFAVPWLYFSVRGRIPKGYQGRMVGLFCMGGTQGLVGWWMVKSGLGEDRRGDKREIRVKPVRLMAHLSMAVATYGALVWTGLDILGIPHKNKLSEIASQMGEGALRSVSRLRMGAIALTGLTGLTIASGALVAGNDAGRAYNSFPKMGEEWIPSEIADLRPWSRNITENTATVQFNHRILGMSTAFTALSLVGMGLGRNPAGAVLLTPQARNGLYFVGAAATAQVSLGIATLLQYVPLHLAAAHQVGSIVVFTGSMFLVHALRYAQPALARAASQTAVKQAAAKVLQ